MPQAMTHHRGKG